MGIQIGGSVAFCSEGILSPESLTKVEIEQAIGIGSSFGDAIDEASMKLLKERNRTLRALLEAPVGSGEAMLEALRADARKAEIAYRVLQTVRFGLLVTTTDWQAY